MFPEYQNLIDKLKGSDDNFTRLYDKHHELDDRIRRQINGEEPATELEIETLKKEKLKLKDQIYAILRTESATSP